MFDFMFVERWQGRITVEIDGERITFATPGDWEMYKVLRSQPFPFTHEEAMQFCNAQKA